MSIAFVAPSISRTSAEPSSPTGFSNKRNQNPNKSGIHRSQTFACCPPATGLNRSNTSRFSTTTKPTRAPTFGLPTRRRTGFGTFTSPRRSRTGIVHFEPQPAKNGLIISGYTCIGKTSFGRGVSLKKKHVLQVIDLDSSAYSKDTANFPGNYLAAIRRCANERTIVLISTHDAVAARLKEEGYYVALVYPEGSADNKQEWLRRLEEREVGGRDSRLYKIVDANWELWDRHLSDCPVSKKVPLSHTDYLLSVFQDIYKDYFQQVVIH